LKKLEWDYTTLAETYSQRPNYADAAIDEIVQAAGLLPGDPVADLGAGTGHMTLKLAARQLDVTSVEPNANMRRIGLSRTSGLSNVRWQEAVMEETGLPSQKFKLVSYGSSFGVAEYGPTLREADRLLAPGGSLVALFNHRDLEDPLQHGVEEIIRRYVPDYQYGNRRVDQGALIESTGQFVLKRRIETPFVHEQDAEEWIAAWSSHATVARQAGDRFNDILVEIADFVRARCPNKIVRVPYTTRSWIGCRR
jgi:ubiquinone/menaquinone biosynthesis C-methylase UbiE